jgi:hypothetical protein
LFANVLKKFFTFDLTNENKVATHTEAHAMKTITDLKGICQRSQATLLQDAIGATALAVMLVVALHAPSLI